MEGVNDGGRNQYGRMRTERSAQCESQKHCTLCKSNILRKLTLKHLKFTFLKQLVGERIPKL